MFENVPGRSQGCKALRSTTGRQGTDNPQESRKLTTTTSANVRQLLGKKKTTDPQEGIKQTALKKAEKKKNSREGK